MAASDGRVLFVDDDEGILLAAEMLLKRQVREIRTESQPERLPEILGKVGFDAIFLDMNFTGGTTSGKEGFHWLQTIRSIDPNAVVILMTAFGDVEMAVRAIKHGATDFILKPWQNEKLIAAVESAVARGQARTAIANDTSDDLQFRQELEFASAVQTRLFPQHPPALRSLEYSAFCKAARGVGGDYYDFIQLGKDQLGLAMGDVSGKGISAALLMASLQGCLQSYAPQHGDSVDTLISDVNRLINTSTDSSRFITLFYGMYHDDRRQLTYVNAGHVPPMLFRADGDRRDHSPERLARGGMVIGVFPHSTYQKEVTQLYPGDLLLLFTDGISEAMDEREEEFGEERLRKLVSNNLALPSRELIAVILDEVEKFAGGRRPHDDLTLVVAKVR